MHVPSVDYQSPDAPQDFVASLLKTGFGALHNHPIDFSQINELYGEWAGFFGSDDKHAYTFDPAKQAGYFPFKAESAKGYPIKDLKEFYHYYRWDRLPQTMSDRTDHLYGKLEEVACTLLKWIEDGTPEHLRATFERPLSEMVRDSSCTLLRILHYPPLSGEDEEGAVRAAPHEDICMLTVLPAASYTGLQVKDLEGNWHDVPCDPGMLIVNAGDMLQELTGGYYPSTTHRVINPVGEAARHPRFSMPLFLHPHDDVRLSAKHTRASYLEERLRELGLLHEQKGLK